MASLSLELYQDHLFAYCTNMAYNDVYESLENDDIADIAMVLYERIKHITVIDENEIKSATKSEMFRLKGNEALKAQKFEQALKFYNLALLYAPKMSWELRAAYSNRSALLFMAKEHKAALIDIEMCLELGCPDNLIEKLIARKEKCLKFTLHNNLLDIFLDNFFPKQLLQLSDKRNPQIPCASKAIEVNMDGAYPTVIAAEDIKPGTLVALETAFVTVTEDTETTCYYCLKISYNLIPCDNCCVALFCDQNCKERCLEEYHEIECKLLNKVDVLEYGLRFKAVIKIKNQCRSWHEFIQAFENHCSTPTTKSSIEEIFSDTSKFSLMHRVSYRHMFYGNKMTAGMIAAMLIKKLSNRNFFPTNLEDRRMAMRAIAGTFIFLTMYVPENKLLQVTLNNNCDISTPVQYGLFSFIGKLQHSCDPNLLVIGLNNKAALVTLCTIPQGTRLTISHYFHHFIQPPDMDRTFNMHLVYGLMCSCSICTDKWSCENLCKDYTLTEAQKKYLDEPDIEISNQSRYIAYYHKLCRGLDLFKNLYNTDVYKKVFRDFYGSLANFQYLKSRNHILIDH